MAFSDALYFLREHRKMPLNMFFTRYIRLRNEGRLYPDRRDAPIVKGGKPAKTPYDAKAILDAINTGGKTPEIGNRLLTPAQMQDLVHFKDMIKTHIDGGNFVLFVLDKTRTEVKELMFVDNAESDPSRAVTGRTYKWNQATLHFG